MWKGFLCEGVERFFFFFFFGATRDIRGNLPSHGKLEVFKFKK